jgi:hypothetical protein
VSELLTELFRGYPVERLRVLLVNENDQVAKAGAWLASELGGRVAPLAQDLEQLLEHPAAYVRFFALDSVLVGTTEEHGEVVSKAITRIVDPHQGVRLKVLTLLSRATEGQLRGGLPYLSTGSLTRPVAWVIGLSSAGDAAQEISSLLEDDDPTTQRFAVAGAARISVHDSMALERAVSSSNPDVSRFATRELAVLRLRPNRRRRAAHVDPGRSVEP